MKSKNTTRTFVCCTCKKIALVLQGQFTDIFPLKFSASHAHIDIIYVILFIHQHNWSKNGYVRHFVLYGYNKMAQIHFLMTTDGSITCEDKYRDIKNLIYMP